MEKVGQEMKKRYKTILTEVTKIINGADPIGLLNRGAPQDENEDEIQRIISGLKTCDNAHEVQVLVYNIFKESFGENSVDNCDQYFRLAEKINKLRKVK